MQNNDPLADLRNINLPFDLDKVSPQCHECVRRQLKKYDKYVDKENKSASGKFLVPCTGILKDPLPSHYDAAMDDDTKKMFLASIDPAAFAAEFLTLPDKSRWIARRCQSEVLRCTSRRKVLREARRLGKCVSYRSNILTEAGRFRPEELVKMANKPKIATFDTCTQQIKLTNNYCIWNNGTKSVYKITTSSGRINYITDNHPFLLMDNNGYLVWKELRDIKIGDHIAVPNSYEEILHNTSENRIDIGDREARLLGYLIGDGGTHYDCMVRLANTNDTLLGDFVDIIADYNCELTQLSPGNYQVVSKCKDKRIKYRNKINHLAKAYNIRHKAVDKFVPDDIFKSTVSNICNFLAAYWDCDGWASVGNKLYEGRKIPSIEIGAGSSSKQLMYDIHHLLLLVGISSFLHKRKVFYNGEYLDSWTISITDASNIYKFADRIPLRAKQSNLNQVLEILKQQDIGNHGKSAKDLVPKSIYNYIENRRKGALLSKRQVGMRNNGTYVRYTPQYAPSRRKLKIFAGNLKDLYLTRLCNSNIQWDRVDAIELVGEELTYDLTVRDTNSLIVDDIISHNTDGICVDAIFNMFTKENVRILLAGPQHSHTKELMGRIRGFIRRNPQLSSMVTRDVSGAQHEIELNNGSRIRGFAAGDKDSADGRAIKGQDADIIYLEEAALISHKAIYDSIMPILQTHPNTSLVAFSTPNGFMTAYRKFCEESPHYKEFHYTYKELPWWREIENDRAQYSQDEWDWNFLAEFGSTEEGVYRPVYIDNALHKYKYDEISRLPTWRYGIGVDWNEKHGTEIMVLGYDKLVGRFQIVDGICIPKSEFTQLKGIQAVLDINKKWRPSFIYADSGGGSTNYEVLMSTAYKEFGPGGDKDTAKLTHILKQYNSGSAIKTKDSITGEEVKVPAKPFMVSASVRLFEQGRIWISSHDAVLEKELKNYIIDRQTPTKVTVYGRKDPKIKDHRLDALNLAIVGFHLEFDDLYKPILVTTAGMVPDPRLRDSNQADKKRNIDQRNISTPEERRLENSVANFRFDSGNLSGRTDRGMEIRKTNRPGWDTDTEEEHMQRYLQRRRARGRVDRDRPKRTNI